MPQSPAFTISGRRVFGDNTASFQLTFTNPDDQALVQAYEWYLDGILIIEAEDDSFAEQVTCGTHTISVRVLSNNTWSGTQELGFETCKGAGILVVDLFNNATLNVIGLIDNAEVAYSHVAAYAGVNIIPAGAEPANALVLASDFIDQPTLNWRFEFNIAKLLTNYPQSTSFVFYIDGRASAPVAVFGAFILKTFASQMTLIGSAGSYIPSVSGNNLGSSVSFTSDLVGGADGSHTEADLTMIIKLVYDVASATISYITRKSIPIDSDFDFMTVKYAWDHGGTDLDIMVGFENNGTTDDFIYVGYGQPNATVPANTVPQTDAYLWWGSDNTTIAGNENVLIGINQFVAGHGGLPDVVEVGLYAVWFGQPATGDFTVQLVTYKGGTMSQSGTDFVNTGGTQVSSVTINANTQIHNSLSTPANAYKVGTLKYTRSTATAVIVIN
ncbi:hypothetical protein [Mucilaginibacter sp.]|uniref:hypothetical protein n=1 Tax=Mucilaginibacter sp. TaxID=1882438 RepID=UPI00262C09FD|nr:hypothetical protein [Mucilaginibacter sp.]MDB4922067.1 hypothetical protein [Mucilaginibacter sp.]